MAEAAQVRFDIREPVLDLIHQKSKMEDELRSLHQILTDNNVDMETPLVDVHGFPRNDIDVYQIRHTRQKIICLKNDLRAVFDQIKEQIWSKHSKVKEAPIIMKPREAKGPHADSVPLKPFALVTMVDIGSPADVAGLCKKDRIIQFGSITHENFSGIESIYNVVSHSVGHPINVMLIRDAYVISVTLIPKPWNNRGLLGCHIQKDTDS